MILARLIWLVRHRLDLLNRSQKLLVIFPGPVTIAIDRTHRIRCCQIGWLVDWGSRVLLLTKLNEIFMAIWSTERRCTLRMKVLNNLWCGKQTKSTAEWTKDDFIRIETFNLISINFNKNLTWELLELSKPFEQLFYDLQSSPFDVEQVLQHVT